MSKKAFQTHGRRRKGAAGRRRVTARSSIRLLMMLFLSLAVICSSIAEIELGGIRIPTTGVPTVQPYHLSSYQPTEPGTSPARPDMRQALHSYAFVSGVGGVAFGGVATSRDGIEIGSLIYVPEAEDGERLQVEIRDDTGESRRIVLPAYDWEFIPAARFVHDNGFACFTYFGRLVGEDDQDLARRRARGERILNYHPAFLNTLMGLRIMQADLLLIYSDACDLPKQDGEYVLGPNENPPDVRANQRRLQTVLNHIRRLPGRSYRSYVICDYERPVTFGLDGNRLRLTGTPIWFCWKNKVASDEQFRRIHESVQENANQQLRREFNADQRTMGPAAFAAKYTPAYRRARFEELYDVEMSERMLQHMPEYSERLTARIISADGINPPVYRALVQTMRLSAFFRHVQQTDIEVFEAFVSQLEGITPAPAVETPPILHESGRRPARRSDQ